VRANDYRSSGSKLRQKALETRLRALRRARKRALEATSVREVAELDDAIASVERALGPSG
jgi:hypothetical protein